MFSVLKIVLNFDSSWVRFWSLLDLFGSPKLFDGCPLVGFEIVLFWHAIFMLFWIASKTTQEAPKCPPDPPKRLQEAPKSAPGGSKSPPRESQEAPRGAQETPGADQEGSRPTKIAPKGSKRTLSQRRLCRSMLQISQRSTKTKHF